MATNGILLNNLNTSSSNIITGTYNGDNTDNRLINIGATPKFVIIFMFTGKQPFIKFFKTKDRSINVRAGNYGGWNEDYSCVDNGFYIGIYDYPDGQNENSNSSKFKYYYIAFC